MYLIITIYISIYVVLYWKNVPPIRTSIHHLAHYTNSMCFSNFECGEQCCNKKKGSSDSTSNLHLLWHSWSSLPSCWKTNGISTPRSKLPSFPEARFVNQLVHYFYYTLHFPVWKVAIWIKECDCRSEWVGVWMILSEWWTFTSISTVERLVVANKYIPTLIVGSRENIYTFYS